MQILLSVAQRQAGFVLKMAFIAHQHCPHPYVVTLALPSVSHLSEKAVMRQHTLHSAHHEASYFDSRRHDAAVQRSTSEAFPTPFL